MNKGILMGRLTRDPEVRYTQDNTAIARYTLAVDRRFKKQNEAQADFINCVAFGRSGEFAEKYLKQGMAVLVKGRILTGNYTNKEGKKVYTTDVVANNVEFLEWGDRAQGGAGQFQSRPQAPAGGDMGIPEGFQAIQDDDIPF